MPSAFPGPRRPLITGKSPVTGPGMLCREGSGSLKQHGDQGKSAGGLQRASAAEAKDYGTPALRAK